MASSRAFANFKDRISVQEYVDRVVAGDLQDSTLSFQLGQGFVVRGLLEDYIEDAASDNWATLIVWTNPYLQARLGCDRSESRINSLTGRLARRRLDPVFLSLSRRRPAVGLVVLDGIPAPAFGITFGIASDDEV